MAAPVKVYRPPLSTAILRVLATVVCSRKMCSFSSSLLTSPLVYCEQPFGQVLAFQDESITIFESRAICRYICENYVDKGNKNLYSTKPLVKASIEQWLEAKSQSYNPPSSTLVFQLPFAPQMNIKQAKAQIKLNDLKLLKVLDIYNQRLDSSRFLAGDRFTLRVQLEEECGPVVEQDLEPRLVEESRGDAEEQMRIRVWLALKQNGICYRIRVLASGVFRGFLSCCFCNSRFLHVSNGINVHFDLMNENLHVLH